MIRIFVGCAANHEDLESQAVLEWSLHKFASKPFHVTWMQLSRDPGSPFCGWNTSQWVTPFSGFRWAIPAVCGFEGRAIYCDSDVIFQADIAELDGQAIPTGKAVLAKGHGSWRFCVSLWDCSAARKWMMPLDELKANPNSHAIMTARFRGGTMVAPFSGNWNCLDGEKFANLNHPAIKAIHYTAIANQPQLKHAIPRLAAEGRRHWYDGKVVPHWRRDLIKLFDDLLEEAKANGYAPERYRMEPFGDCRKQSLRNYRAGPRAA